jgi:hypothetical protein
MELFDIEAGKVVLDPNVLYIPEFKQIWDRDKGKDKNIATAQLAYVTFLCNFSSKNPYNSYSDKDKEKKVRDDTTKKEPDELIKKAIKKYKEMQQTVTSRLLVAAKVASNVLAEYFEGAKAEDATEIIRNIEKLGNAVKSLYALEIQVQKEQLESKVIRGGKELGMYEI